MSLINVGQFRAAGRVWGFTKTENGKPKFAIEFEILRIANAPEEETCEDTGRRITWFGGLEGKGFDYSTKAMKVCGWDGVMDPSSDDARFDSEVHITIEHREYPEGSGDIRAEVKYVNALDDAGGGTPGYLIDKFRMPADEASAFANEFLARVKSARSGSAPAAQSRTPNAASSAKPQAAPARTAQPAPAPRPTPKPAPARVQTTAKPAAPAVTMNDWEQPVSADDDIPF